MDWVGAETPARGRQQVGERRSAEHGWEPGGATRDQRRPARRVDRPSRGARSVRSPTAGARGRAYRFRPHRSAAERRGFLGRARRRHPRRGAGSRRGLGPRRHRSETAEGSGSPTGAAGRCGRARCRRCRRHRAPARVGRRRVFRCERRRHQNAAGLRARRRDVSCAGTKPPSDPATLGRGSSRPGAAQRADRPAQIAPAPHLRAGPSRDGGAQRLRGQSARAHVRVQRSSGARHPSPEHDERSHQRAIHPLDLVRVEIDCIQRGGQSNRGIRRARPRPLSEWIRRSP